MPKAKRPVIGSSDPVYAKAKACFDKHAKAVHAEYEGPWNQELNSIALQRTLKELVYPEHGSSAQNAKLKGKLSQEAWNLAVCIGKAASNSAATRQVVEGKPSSTSLVESAVDLTSVG